jgi:YD repeat-containing protein
MLYWRKWGYDGFGNKTSDKIVRNFATEVTTPSNTTPNGPVLTYTFDVNGLYPVSVARAGKANADVTATTQTASVSYDSLGRAILGINDNWYTKTFNYNTNDQRIEATDAFGKQRSYEFDANGNVIGERLLINNQLHDSRYADFDWLDRKTMTMDAGGNITYYEYDAGGNLVQITDPDNYQQSFEYDAANYAVKYFDQLNNYEQRSFDLSGKPRSDTDRNGNQTSFTYYSSSKDGRLQEKTDAANHAQAFDYDANGNAINITAVGADGTTQRSSVMQYDELNRQTRRVGPTYSDATLGSIRPVTKFTYNTLGQLENVSAGYTPELTGLSSTQDVLTTQRSFTYDDYSRRISEADGLTRTWQYRYDSNNNLSTATDPMGQTTTYSWAYGNQLASLTDDDAQTYTYTRNNLGQITRAVSPLVTYCG